MANPTAPLQFGQAVVRDGVKGDFIFHGFARRDAGHDENTALISRDGESKIESVPAGTLKAKPVVVEPKAQPPVTEKAK